MKEINENNENIENISSVNKFIYSDNPRELFVIQESSETPLE